MPPKPFPYPIGIGIDVCKPSRILRLMQNPRTLNRWLRKVFTRREWPGLVSRFENARMSFGAGVASAGGPAVTDGLKQPQVSAVTDALAQHLAGRWAAKEAVMKAHRHRRLSFHDISITDSRGDIFEAEEGIRFNLNAVIDPPTRLVQMDQKVATLRGLRGFRGGEEEPDVMAEEAELIDSSGSKKQGNPEQSERLRIPIHTPFFTRRSLVKDEERQIAELSIAHENSVAVAICMALNHPSEEMAARLESIIDDGSGEPIHEPAWGDRGFIMAGAIKVANTDG